MTHANTGWSRIETTNKRENTDDRWENRYWVRTLGWGGGDRVVVGCARVMANGPELVHGDVAIGAEQNRATRVAEPGGQLVRHLAVRANRI
jgi:hypothetical protein